MSQAGTILGAFFPLENITAITALPEDFFVSFKSFAFRQVRQQLTIHVFRAQLLLLQSF
jgi:hypothetical protein